MKWFKYIALGVFFYFIFMVALFPAPLAYTLAQKAGITLPVRMAGLDGSVWAGRAQVVSMGTTRLEQVSWDVHVLPLLWGRVEMDWRLRLGEGKGAGVLGATFGGNYYLRDVEGQFSAATLANLLRIQALRPEGGVTLRVERLKLRDHAVSALDGVLVWSDARMNVLQPMPLGDIKVTFTTGDGEVQARVVDGGGPLKLDGTLSLKPDGAYQASANLGVRDSSQTVLQQALSMLGNPDATGHTQWASSGTLASAGILLP